MSLSSSENVFKDDPFFDQARFLWPMQRGNGPLSAPIMPDISSLREDFFRRRTQLLQGLQGQMRSSLFGELSNGLPSNLLQGLEQLRSSSSSPAPSCSSCSSCSSTSTPSPAPSSPSRMVPAMAQPNVGVVAHQNNGPIAINMQGFGPDDIRVTVSGRRLEIMASKQAESADNASMSDATRRCSASRTTCKQQGFIRRVELPEDVDPASVTCSLGEDGFLRIETQPWKQLEEPKEEERKKDMEEVVPQARDEQASPVRYRTSLDFTVNSKSTSPEFTIKKST